MKNSNLKIYAIMLAVCFLPATTGFAEELRFDFKAGDKFFLSTDVMQHVSQMVDNNEVITDQTTRIGCDLDIIEVNENGDALAQYTYRKAYLKLNKGSYNITYDSEANQVRIPVDALPLGLILGQNVFLKISPPGRIISIKGVTALISSTKAAAPLSQTRYQAFDFIDKNFNEQAIKRFIQERIAIFPEQTSKIKNQNTADISSDVNSPSFVTGTVSPGESWIKVADLNDEPPVRAEIWMFKIKEKQKGMVSMDVNVNVATSPNNEDIITGGTRFKHDISGYANGKIEIDEEKGTINENITWDINDVYKASAEGPVLRLIPPPPPVKSHMVSRFQMTRRQD